MVAVYYMNRKLWCVLSSLLVRASKSLMVVVSMVTSSSQSLIDVYVYLCVSVRENLCV